MSRVRDFFVLLPSVLTVGALATYGLTMILVSLYRVCAVVSLVPFLLAGPCHCASVLSWSSWSAGPTPTDSVSSAAIPSRGCVSVSLGTKIVRKR